VKILLKVALNPYSGYGSDGIGMAQCLLEMGMDVYLHPIHVSPPLPPQIASLLTKRLEAPFDLMIHHVDPAQLGLDQPARRAAKVAIGWTMWEYSSLENLKTKPSHRKRFGLYDAIIAYDTVTAGALEPHLHGPKLGVVQGGYWPQLWPYMERDWHSDRFGFAMHGQLHERKDPFVAIQAFTELKMEYPDEFEPAELHLHTNIPGLHPAMEQVIPKLRIHYDVWPQDILREFYRKQHVLLAPSRGEGKNMPALEFLSTGGTVIATDWGGHQQWLSPAYGYPLDYELRPVSGAHPTCLNARASKDHLKALMLHTFRNRDEAREKGLRGSEAIPALCGWHPVMERLFVNLAELVPGGGHLLAAFRGTRAREFGTRGVSVYA
jgi:glycosyltransferase involved in cell wall biosynthesis